MRLKYIHTYNLQSHKDVRLEFPEEGVVVFHGDNSSGKSVIRRTLEYILDGSINVSNKRCPLIRKGESFAELEMEASTGLYFKIHITHEASGTYGLLRYSDGNEVVRYLRDKAIAQLLREFRFHYDDNRDISLTIRNTDNGLPFITTSPVVNGELLNSSLTDEKAVLKIESIKEHQMSVKADIEKTKMQIESSNTILNSIVITDEEEDLKISEICMRYHNILSHIYVPNLEFNLPTVPDVDFIEIYRPRLKKICYPHIVELYSPKIEDLTKLYDEIKMIEEGVCPLCHQPLCHCSQ